MLAAADIIPMSLDGEGNRVVGVAVEVARLVLSCDGRGANGDSLFVSGGCVDSLPGMREEIEVSDINQVIAAPNVNVEGVDSRKGGEDRNSSGELHDG